MKKLFPWFIGLAILLGVSCQKEETVLKETGRLSVRIGLEIREYGVESRIKSASAVEDFRVVLYRADGNVERVFETLTAMPDTIELLPGRYYLEAHSNNDLPAAFENPYYYGVSELFAISSNTQQSVQVTCRLANTMVSVRYSDATARSFTGYSATVSTALGTLVFGKDEVRTGYFRTSPLDVVVELIWLNPGGVENRKMLTGRISDPLAGRHYGILVNATADPGQAMFAVLLDETAIPVEVIELTEQVDDTEIPPVGATGYGDLLITEIMYDPQALADTEGEWIEIYNNSGKTIDLHGLVVDRGGTNRHTINTSIELLPGQFYVLARTASATNALNQYSYGNSISLPNTGAVLSIFLPGEGQGETLIFSVDYGGIGFPTGTGASIQLNPSGFNAAAAVSGTSWCRSVSIYSTGDRGTPGRVNDACL